MYFGIEDRNDTGSNRGRMTKGTPLTYEKRRTAIAPKTWKKGMTASSTSFSGWKWSQVATTCVKMATTLRCESAAALLGPVVPVCPVRKAVKESCREAYPS